MKKFVPFFVVVVILLVAGGFYFYLRNKPQRVVPPTPLSTSNSQDNSIISGVVDGFYRSYDSCMKNPPEASLGKVSEYCQSSTGLTTLTFAANLEKGGTAKAGADPIFCAQSIPESVIVDPNIQVTSDKTIALVNEVFGPSQIVIQAELLNEGGNWKVDNIVCPLPQ